MGHDEISRGRLHKVGANSYLQKSYDLLTSFKDVLGKRVREVPGNDESGELVQDTAMDLEINVSTEFTRSIKKNQVIWTVRSGKSSFTCA